MAIQGNELRTMFWGGMPREYMRRAVDVLSSAYLRADEACRNILELEPSEADNARWAVRRALIEGGLRQILIPPMTAEVVYGRDAAVPHPWNHTLITAGNVLMTQCSVQHFDDIVRPSIAREIYSLPNHARYLFSDMQPPERPNANPLYCILIHGREAGTDQLGFVYIRFPKAGAQEWWPEKINLLTDLDEPMGLTPEEPVEGPPLPQIREGGHSA